MIKVRSMIGLAIAVVIVLDLGRGWLGCGAAGPSHAGGGCCGWIRLGGFDQLDVEDERGLRGNRAGTPAFAVCQVVGHDELALSADLHGADAFGPPWDDAVEREGGGFAAIARAIEFLAIDEISGVVHLYLCGR